MSEQIKHECGIAFIRLLKPLSFYQKKYGTALYGLNKLYLLMEKQHNRGQDGAGVATIKLDIEPGKRYISRHRSMAQNAFMNTASSLVLSKVQGNIVDVLMPPLSAGELMVAFTLGGVIRGLVVGVVTGVAIWLFLPFGLPHPGYAVYHGLMAVIMLSLLGVIGGIWAEKFDHIAGVTNFVVTPLSFLSGTFYSVTSLPEPVQWLAYADPFFYMIDGFRYGFTGQCDGSLVAGLVMMLAGNLGLGFLAWRMLRTGYKLKA